MAGGLARAGGWRCRRAGAGATRPCEGRNGRRAPYLPAGALGRSGGALGGAPGSLGTHEQGSWDGVSAAGAPLDAALGAGSIRADVLVWAIRGFKWVYRRTLFGALCHRSGLLCHSWTLLCHRLCHRSLRAGLTGSSSFQHESHELGPGQIPFLPLLIEPGQQIAVEPDAQGGRLHFATVPQLGIAGGPYNWGVVHGPSRQSRHSQCNFFSAYPLVTAFYKRSPPP